MRHVHEARAESRVVNEQLIRDGIQIRDVAVTSIEEKRQSIAFEDIQSLTLSFLNLVSIDHLEGLRALTKLQLDNNKITKICNLDALEQLEWLDLSFNEIECIEGLNQLAKLTDLSLFSNKIQRIENLESLQNLQILSLGNNEIAETGSIDALRPFKQLRVLKLSGNPICKMEDYRSYVLSRLEMLDTLDSRRITEPESSDAKERYQDELIEILEKEEKQWELHIEEEEALKHQLEMQSANLAGVEDLFSRVEMDDPDWQRLKHISGVTELWNETKTKFNTATEDFKSSVMAQVEKREVETTLWNQAVERYTSSKTEISKEQICEFEKDKKRQIRQGGSDRHLIAANLKTKLMHLKQLLMQNEDQRVVIQKQLLQQYEAALSELSSKNSTLYATYFTQVGLSELALWCEKCDQIRDLLNGFAHGVNVVVLGAFERLHLDGDFDKASEEARQLLNDKETLMASLQNSQDFRTLQIDTVEEECTHREGEMLRRTSQDAILVETRRNRDRLTEILGYVERNIMELEELSEMSEMTASS